MSEKIKFPKLVDVYSELSIGNFKPIILALYDMKKDPYYINQNGFNIIHYIISNGNINLYKRWIMDFNNLKIIKTKKLLTNLQVSSLNTNLEMIKVVSLDDNNNFNFSEGKAFPISINFINSNNLVSLFYINHKKNIDKSIIKNIEPNNNFKIENQPEEILIEDSIFNLDIKDSNDCNFLHWTSYTDNLFMLKIYYRFGSSFLVKDIFEDTVLDKTFTNNSIHCLIYILKEQIYPKTFPYYLKNKKKIIFQNNLIESDNSFLKKFNTNLKSKYIKSLFDLYFDIKDGTYDSISTFIKVKGIQNILDYISYNYNIHNPIYDYGKIIFYSWIDFSFLLTIFLIFINTNLKNFLIFFIIQLFILLIIIFSINKILNTNYIYKSLKDYQISNNYRIKDTMGFMTKSMEKSKYIIKDKLYKNYLKSQNLNDYFENEIINKFDKNEFDYLYNVNFENYCPLCLIKKPLQTRHISKIGLCIKGFWLYSYFFDVVITINNIKLYLIFLIFLLLFSILNCYSFIFMKGYKYKFLILFELFLGSNLFENMFLILNYILILYILKNILLILYCILNNYTVDEIRNPQKYSYLFKRITIEDKVENEEIVYKDLIVKRKRKNNYCYNAWNFFVN